MFENEAALEAAEDFEREQLDRKVASIRSAFVLAGDDTCQDCGDPIGAERRAALPSATRCVECQGGHERRSQKDHAL